MGRNLSLLALSFLPALAFGQDTPQMSQILERLERLERENRNLAAEVHELRQALAKEKPQPALSDGSLATEPGESDANNVAPGLAAAPQSGQNQAPLDERVAVEERRTDELEQAKIEASQKFPLSLTGMVLFNAFLNGKSNSGQQDPLVAGSGSSTLPGGASLGQTVLGLKYQGPEILGGGKVNGSLYMDFFGGTNSSLGHTLRIRVASVEIDWKNQTFMVGQDKPIISPREPNSLAEVGFSPLTAAGNLWLWQPQARFEQRFSMGEETGLRAQLGVYQTSESSLRVPAEYAGTLASARPGLEGRFEFWHDFGSGRRFEIAPGFHTSSSHVAGTSVPSDIFSVDWLIRPWSRFDFSGMFYQGQNVSVLGALPQGIEFGPHNLIQAVHSTGGWGQFSYRPTSRLSFNIYGGEQDDRNSQLTAGQIGKNLAYAGNMIYRLGPNVLASLEAEQVRTSYIGSRLILNNHYDLGLAYLF